MDYREIETKPNVRVFLSGILGVSIEYGSAGKEKLHILLWRMERAGKSACIRQLTLEL